MNLEQLKIFISVVDYRSFTKAAATMYISHSTTSRNVSLLEEDLGVQLLYRESRLVRLTPAGEILYREGRKLIDKIESVEGAVRNAGLGLAGKLNIAGVSLRSSNLYDGCLNFCRRYPEVVLGVFHREITDIWPMVNTGAADIGITFSYALREDMTGFEQVAVSKEKFCAVTPISHPLAMRKSVTLDDLFESNYISILPSGCDILKEPALKSSAGLPSDKVSAAPTIESLFLQVRAGNKVSAVPCPLAYEYGSDCAIMDIEDVEASFDMVMFWRSDNLNPTLPLFTETIISNAK